MGGLWRFVSLTPPALLPPDADVEIDARVVHSEAPILQAANYTANWSRHFCDEFLRILNCPVFKDHPKFIPYCISIAMNCRTGDQVAVMSNEDFVDDDGNFLETYMAFVEFIPSATETFRSRKLTLNVIAQDLTVVELAWNDYRARWNETRLKETSRRRGKIEVLLDMKGYRTEYHITAGWTAERETAR